MALKVIHFGVIAEHPAAVDLTVIPAPIPLPVITTIAAAIVAATASQQTALQNGTIQGDDTLLDLLDDIGLKIDAITTALNSSIAAGPVLPVGIGVALIVDNTKVTSHNQTKAILAEAERALAGMGV